jgi:ABC-type multidrug transport system ATPase subunit
MHKPKLLVLDEPTNGLDPLVQAEFNKIILDLKESGSTIFISSHILSEVQELCDEFIFIKRGKIVAQLTKRELLARSHDNLTVRPSAKQREKLLAFLKQQGIVYKIDQVDLEAEFMKYYEDDHA